LIDTVHDFDVEKLACSPDGRTLAVGDSTGAILLYETETLRLLYKITHKSNHAIRNITFSADSERLIDIRESQCNVWEPPVLMRTEPQETESMSDMLPTLDENLTIDEEVAEISAIASTACGKFVLCGTDNGAVALHLTETGEQIQLLYEHTTRSWVSQIAVSPKAVASIGGTNELTVKTYRAIDRWVCDDVLHTHYQEPIRQLLFNAQGSKLLVVLNDSVEHFDLEAEGVNSRSEPTSDEIWANDPTRPDTLFAIQYNLIRQFSWDSFSLISTLGNAEIVADGEPRLVVQHAAPTAGRKHMGIALSKGDKRPFAILTALLDCSSFQKTGATPHVLHPVTAGDDTKVEHIIGIQGNKLYFLDKDLWLCSLALGVQGATCSHHMFIPDEWLKANNRPLLLLTTKGELVIAKRDEIAIIKRPLTYTIAF
jgi:hypothetical protein